MSMFDFEAMDEDLKGLLRAMPWVGFVVTAALWYITANAYFLGSIKFMNTRFGYNPSYVTFAERPTDYLILLGFLLVISCGLSAYCLLRLWMRAKLRKIS